MNILHLITSINKGGAENHLACLARGQVFKKNKVFVIFLKGNSYWKKYYSKIGIKVINLKNCGSGKAGILKRIFFLKNFFVKFNIDVVHAHLPHMELYSWLAIMLSNKKYKFIISKHVDNDFIGGSNYKNNSIIASFVSYLISKKASKVIAISKAVKKYFSESFFNIKSNKIKVIYYGIDNSYIKLLLNGKNKINIPKKKLIFGSIGRLVKQKNFELILQSFKIFLDKGSSDSLLVIAGSGPEEKNLKKFAQNIGINKSIIWLGDVDKVGDILKQIDVFCMNSRFEGLGLVMLEAMAFSKPIIAPRISAIPEVVKNNVNGILVKKNSLKDYSNAMLKISQKNYIRKFSKKSKTILIKKFNFDKMINKTQKIYLN